MKKKITKINNVSKLYLGTHALLPGTFVLESFI